MKNIGEIYETPTEISISDGLLLCKKGLKLITIGEIFDQADVHYFRALKIIPKDEEVEVIGTWKNFYGSYIRCKYNAEVYDIKPQYLKFK